MAETVRAFVAIEVPEVVRGELARLVERLRRETSGVKWVETEGVHLTLKFLGNVPRGQLEATEAAIRQVARTAGPFTLSLSDLGSFPESRQPRVLWVGLAGELKALLALQEEVEKALQPVGFAREGRPFAPHLTLGRLRDTASPAQRRQAGEALGRATWKGSAAFTAEALSLMQSTLTPEGARYTCLQREPLAAGSAAVQGS
ncbi:MAG: RNA 2',3'-cyclic phosphodiesterase [Chloroflexi bacterium]|nr:RNA 2',3'-cyclic phosphodiesterase [Chloroflexota bacterium]